MKKMIKNPDKLWSDSFITDGELSVSMTKPDEFDHECVNMLHLTCVEAYFDENNQLHLVFKQ